MFKKTQKKTLFENSNLRKKLVKSPSIILTVNVINFVPIWTFNLFVLHSLFTHWKMKWSTITTLLKGQSIG